MSGSLAVIWALDVFSRGGMAVARVGRFATGGFTSTARYKQKVLI